MQAAGSNFIRALISAHLAEGRYSQPVTRFPPEPNGYPHIGHAKAICINFGLATELGGHCYLRFDDTNPSTEDEEYVEAMKDAIHWLGFEWDALTYTSDYFEQLYAWAEHLISAGLAYVDDSNEDEIRASRGTVTTPGTASVYRDRSAHESLDLFRRMRAGEFEDGAKVLRARIDLAHPNMKLRDPLLYRIRHAHHYRRGDDWCIYPFYDWAHGQSDAIEGITHSLCTLEFENNRELYDWFIAHLPVPCEPHQYESARLSLSYTVTSKRKMLALVREGHVRGWDDPRMPTLAGFRRRGVRPEAIRAFMERIGVAKTNSVVDPALLDTFIRDDLNAEAPRMMCVLDPLELVIDDWAAERVDAIDAPLWPHDVPREGSRDVFFGRRLLIEHEDFSEAPSGKFRRLAPGREVRLRYGYVVRCVSVEHDPDGRVLRVHCTHDPDSRGGNPSDGRKIKGTIHWVNADHAVPVEVRVYDRLFSAAHPGARTGDVRDDINPDSLRVVRAQAEAALATAAAGERFQFERLGYYYADAVDSAPGAPVFNLTVSLKDSHRKAAPAPPLVAKDASKKASRRKSPVVRAPDHQARFEALRAQGLSEKHADLLGREADVLSFFQAVAVQVGAASAAKWVINGVLPGLEGAISALRFDAGSLAALIALVEAGTLTNAGGRRVLELLFAEGGVPAEIVAREGLQRVDDSEALGALVAQVVADNPSQLERYRSNPRLFGFFVGQVMKATGGSADPTQVRALLELALSEG